MYDLYGQIIICKRDSVVKTIMMMMMCAQRGIFQGYNMTTLIHHAYIFRNVSSDFEGVKISISFIKYRTEDAFKCYTKLKVINLGQNNIIALPQELFTSNELLDTMDFSYNNFYIIENSTFSLYGIHNLNLQHNRLYELNIVLQLSLVNLELSFNLITHITRDSFVGMSNLKTLSLQNNLLKTLGIDCFRDLHNLDTLSLSNNRIETTSGSLRSLQNLAIRCNIYHRLQRTFLTIWLH